MTDYWEEVVKIRNRLEVMKEVNPEGFVDLLSDIKKEIEYWEVKMQPNWYGLMVELRTTLWVLAQHNPAKFKELVIEVREAIRHAEQGSGPTGEDPLPRDNAR